MATSSASPGEQADQLAYPNLSNERDLIVSQQLSLVKGGGRAIVVLMSAFREKADIPDPLADVR